MMKKKTQMILICGLSLLFIVSLVLYYNMFRWWLNTWFELIAYTVMLGVSTGGMAVCVVLSKGEKLKKTSKVLLSILVAVVAGAIPLGLTFLMDGLYKYSAYHQVTTLVTSIDVLLYAALLFVYCRSTIFAKAKIVYVACGISAVAAALGIVVAIGGYQLVFPIYNTLSNMSGDMGGYKTSDSNLKYAFANSGVRFTQADILAGEADTSLLLKVGQEKSFQFLVAAETADETVYLEVADFTNARGDTLTTQAFYSEYTRFTHRLTSITSSNTLPDNMLSLDSSTALSIPSRSQLAFFVFAKAEADAQEGTYTSRLTLKDEHGTVVFEKEVTATVSGSALLHYGEDGEFVILQLADLQSCPLIELEKELIRDAIEDTHPDLIILSGDNIYDDARSWRLAPGNIAEYMDVLEEYSIPVAMVFGNHDSELWGQMGGKFQQFGIYNQYDCFVGSIGEVCANRVGNYNLPIYSATGDDIVSNLWLFDSGLYNDENDLGGYACVRKEQVDWYLDAAKALQEANGGMAVPSLTFQHIAIHEVLDVLVKTENDYILPEGALGTKDPNQGIGASLYTNGQFDAFLTQGDVMAVAWGHDHLHDYELSYKGIDFINTPIASFSSDNGPTVGYRVFVLNEETPDTYETYVGHYYEIYAENEELIARFDELTVAENRDKDPRDNGVPLD